MENNIPLLIAWLLYFTLHSALASNTVKGYITQAYPALRACYRVIYNGVAIVSLVPVIFLMFINQGTQFIIWPEALFPLKALVLISAIACFIWSLTYYDLKAFMGVEQCRSKKADTQSGHTLVISPIHRFVRHPWYSCALFILWFRDMNTAQFVSTLLISGYFVIGSFFEERRLVAEHGEQYRRYQHRVAALIPLPWKYLSKKEALTMNARV